MVGCKVVLHLAAVCWVEGQQNKVPTGRLLYRRDGELFPLKWTSLLNSKSLLPLFITYVCAWVPWNLQFVCPPTEFGEGGKFPIWSDRTLVGNLGRKKTKQGLDLCIQRKREDKDKTMMMGWMTKIKLKFRLRPCDLPLYIMAGYAMGNDDKYINKTKEAWNGALESWWGRMKLVYIFFRRILRYILRSMYKILYEINEIKAKWENNKYWIKVLYDFHLKFELSP